MTDLLQLASRLIYQPYQWKLSDFKEERESREYEACRFRLNDLSVICRTAKITPTKTGQFVTLWKRSVAGPIEPFEASDSIDLLMVNVSRGDLSGQFLFPRQILLDKGVLTGNGKEGKRAIRVYPPWDVAGSRQAQKTRKWQSEFFLPLHSFSPADYKKAKKLYLQDQDRTQ